MNKNQQFFAVLIALLIILALGLSAISAFIYDEPIGYHYVGPTPPPGNPMNGLVDIYGEVRIYQHQDGSQTWERGYKREYKQK